MSEDIAALIKERDELKTQLEELKKKSEEPSVCNRCGRDDKLAPLKVRDDVKQKYFKSMLGQIPFTHTLTALDGQLSATFMMQRGDVLIAKYKEGATVGEDSIKSMLVSTLVTVKVVDKATEIEKVLYAKKQEELLSGISDVPAAYEEILKSLDIVQLAFVRMACDTFTLLVSQLIEAVSSEDFFEGAGLL